ncbi:MAG TPA: SDR family oxidoreductase [Microthrixaceae bacterium]|nr:SDR family oxidoreductase [Microthrixaceae bacterium]MCB9376266.1 SDR family oxidoreductase [Microthrixaceae bacterium]HPG13791.1 SDR family oxidoreductase [Microthrixaceae bacterium]HRW40039.1 SDR family oxidoreductase [Microthrixaceae bacterium]
MTDLVGRVVVITGGNGGIGLGMAHGVAAAGAAVAVWGRDEAKNDAAVEALRAAGAVASSVVVDVADEAAVDAAMAQTLAVHGRVDTMIANAGIGGGAPFVDQTLEQWRRVMAVNLDGAFLCFRAATRHLLERGEGGSLIGVSSTSAIHGAPANQAYSCSKTAMIALIRGLAVELARHGVRVNGIMPGWVETDMTAPLMGWEKFMTNTTARTPVRRWGVPSDFAEAAAFLADPTLTFHTGDLLVIDGGYSIF